MEPEDHAAWMKKVNTAHNVLTAFGLLAFLFLATLVIWGLMVRTFATILLALFIGGISLFVWAVFVALDAKDLME